MLSCGEPQNRRIANTALDRLVLGLSSCQLAQAIAEWQKQHSIVRWQRNKAVVLVELHRIFIDGINDQSVSGDLSDGRSLDGINPTPDFFICDITDAVPKGDMAGMEHPLFSLSTKPDMRTRRYEHNNA